IATLSDAQVMDKLGRRGVAPEGRFLPETYAFTRGTTDLQILERAARSMDGELDRVWRQRDPGLPFKSPDELLTLASIVEKETGLAPERPQIAGVFVRRLEKGMLLQTDPTVIYGMGSSYNGNIRKADLERDTPWNTYRRAGLPPTPIAMPGKAALEAVAHPVGGQSLYFVASGGGGHVFSDSLDAHNAAVRKYQLHR
ncbi:MAG: endolytic transglycosylase MltG, partial [Arenimonas sp.]